VAPGLLWGDSAEMQVLAALGGVAHPTGYPLFTLLARALVIVTGGPPAFLANLFSSLFAAATLALLTAFLLERGVRTPAVLAAALAWGLSFTFWTTSHRAEVYSLAAFVALGGLWCALAAIERGARTARLAAGFLLGLTLAGHMAFAPFVMVAGLVLAWRVPRAGVLWIADELALLGTFLLGLSPYLYLLWADGHRIGFDYLDLVVAARWPVPPVPATFRSLPGRFWWLLASRNEYPPKPFQMPLYMLGKNVSDISFLLSLFELGPITAAAVVAGIVARWRANSGETRLLLALGLASIVFSLFTSGYKILSVFLIPCYLVCAVFAGHGLDAVFRALARRRGSVVAAAVVLALPAREPRGRACLAARDVRASARALPLERDRGGRHPAARDDPHVRELRRGAALRGVGVHALSRQRARGLRVARADGARVPAARRAPPHRPDAPAFGLSGAAREGGDSGSAATRRGSVRWWSWGRSRR
jgi:hypothetical protein